MGTKRNPDLTRARLLEAGFEEIYQHGFRAASLDSILERAGVTKGALYHHFPNKNALGYAIIDELIRVWIYETWIEPLKDCDNPIDCLQETIHSHLDKVTQEACSCGCPLNNLNQEMSSEDEGFRLRISKVIEGIQQGVAEALRRGQVNGTVRADIDVERTAGFFFAAVEGIAGVSKNSQSSEVMRLNFEALSDYLDTLRVVRAA